ncbi:unnamed protein product [Brassicogethes aeneus]|uniref:Uncharacterized protein n=1 Tax=Brassicogethes aeneus TaxID=1431903 RepID=A0A9P0FD10_BRAAE|nr:unnamed protein product [Brassicogethes aeneus]
MFSYSEIIVFFTCLLVVNGQITTEKVDITTTFDVEAQELEFDKNQDERQPVVHLNSLAGQNIPIASSMPGNANKNVPNFLQKFTTPIKDGLNSKLDLINNKFNQLNNYFNHPNSKPFVALQSLSPQKIWEKINNKAGVLSTGANSAIFGLTHNGNPDYPFAYRDSRSYQDKSWKDALKNYENKGPKPFVYQDFSKITQIKNNTYNFQHLEANFTSPGYIFDKNNGTMVKPMNSTLNLVNDDSIVIENLN